ncbi:hypothetical protein [Haloplanus rubicundus]|uniref:hypothetical protein n=1 Tax=Haloplanus rubicundus TaxID=1547898 RepID=UPI0013002F22|nr:hypothetical protein [Haloplanus rubicundus]
MGTDPSNEIDALAIKLEYLIAQNEEVLAEYEEEHTPFSESSDSRSSHMETDPTELFS